MSVQLWQAEISMAVFVYVQLWQAEISMAASVFVQPGDKYYLLHFELYKLWNDWHL